MVGSPAPPHNSTLGARRPAQQVVAARRDCQRVVRVGLYAREERGLEQRVARCVGVPPGSLPVVISVVSVSVGLGSRFSIVAA